MPVPTREEGEDAVTSPSARVALNPTAPDFSPMNPTKAASLMQDSKSQTKNTRERRVSSLDKAPLATLTNRVIVSGKITPSSSAALFKAIEEKFGKINSTHAHATEKWAAIEFEAPAAADAAVQAKKFKFDGTTFDLKFPDPNDVDHPISNSLVLKNLPFQLTYDEIEEHLRHIGCPPNKLELLTDSKGKFRGVAFVKYATDKEAHQALKSFQNTEFRGRPVEGEYRMTPLLGARSRAGSIHSVSKSGKKNSGGRQRTQSFAADTSTHRWGRLNGDSPVQNSGAGFAAFSSVKSRQRSGSSNGETLARRSTSGRVSQTPNLTSTRYPFHKPHQSSPLATPSDDFALDRGDFSLGASTWRDQEGNQQRNSAQKGRATRSLRQNISPTGRGKYKKGNGRGSFDLTHTPTSSGPVSSGHLSSPLLKSSFVPPNLTPGENVMPASFVPAMNTPATGSERARAVSFHMDTLQQASPLQNSGVGGSGKQFLFPARYAKGPDEGSTTGFTRSRSRTMSGCVDALRRCMDERSPTKATSSSTTETVNESTEA